MRKKTVQTSSTKSSTKGNAKSNTKSNARLLLQQQRMFLLSKPQLFRSHLLNRMNRTFQRDSLIWDREEVLRLLVQSVIHLLRPADWEM